MYLNKKNHQDASKADFAKRPGISRPYWRSFRHLHASLLACIYTLLVVRARGVAAVEEWWGLDLMEHKPTILWMSEGYRRE